LPNFRRVDLVYRSTLAAANEPLTAAFFPEIGYASMLATLEDGDAAEVGIDRLRGHDRAAADPRHRPLPYRSNGAVRGSALWLEAEVLRRALDDWAELRNLLLRYAMAFNVQVAMTAACNVRHLWSNGSRAGC